MCVFHIGINHIKRCVIKCPIPDRHHLHSHFVLNSVSFVDGKKFNSCKKIQNKNPKTLYL
ncbi:MAG: hypothetical protein E7543_07535 [Ruminococcaceae bacterium]|nr:hypothetical protein [Oscillospiraceae bacterium]